MPRRLKATKTMFAKRLKVDMTTGTQNNRSTLRVVCVLALIVACISPSVLSQPVHRPRRAENFADVDAIIQKAVDGGTIPGAVVLIGHNDRIVYRKAFGSRSLEPTRETMSVGTIFDLASLTKCIATTTAIMQLVEAGRIRLNDPVSAYLPEFSQNWKSQITVRELLTHYSGLAPDLDLKEPW